MTYVVLEMQTNGGTTAIVPAVTYADRNQAESAFHMKLGSAAISAVEDHAVVMLTSDGRVVRNEHYVHISEPEPTPEPEPEEE